ncbi:hypothetical protein EII17_03405 [Clostridiales bacterium COT073_COT-073]|nr:hypothetical protein EII17_03405 [Clostridiales bacterium COT073_COT-073]
MKKPGVFLIIICFLLSACAIQPKQAKADVNAFKAASLETAQMEDEVPRMVSDKETVLGQNVDDAYAQMPEVHLNSTAEEVKTGDAAEEFVKMTYYHRDKNLIAPLIQLPSPDADRVNRELKQKVLAMADKVDQSFMTYRALLNQNVLSILIQMDEGTHIEFKSYNFNIETGKEMTVDEVLKFAGLDWQLAESIFYAERKAYWRSLKKLTELTDKEAMNQLNYEVAELHQSYQTQELPIILDEDGLANVVCVLLDDDGVKYWQLFTISGNRTILLQRNAYGAEFPAVIIESPTQEEMLNLKIVGKISSDSQDSLNLKSFLVLPLWEDLEFEWLKQEENLAGNQELRAQQRIHVTGGEAIYIEMSQAQVDSRLYQAAIIQGEDQGNFSPNDFHEVSEVELGILYLPLE